MLTKSESLQLKGAAILIMVFLHLFINSFNVDLCQTYLYFRGEPVVSQLSEFLDRVRDFYFFRRMALSESLSWKLDSFSE